MPSTTDVDYSRQGEKIHITDDIPWQTILYSVTDIFNQPVQFSVEARRYIQDSRRKKPWQRYVLNYLDRISLILRDPTIVILDPDDFTERTQLYYRDIQVIELERSVLFALVVRSNKEKVVYNLHPQESGKIKAAKRKPPPRVLYLKPGIRKKRYF